MSQENVESVRAAFAAWNAGELPDSFSHFHPQIVYHARADEPDPGPHVGRDVYEQLMHGFRDSFSGVTIEVLELIDVGDRVIASTVLHAVPRGSASGTSVSDTYVFVYKLRDGLVVEGWEYKTKQEALKAAGLEE